VAAAAAEEEVSEEDGQLEENKLPGEITPTTWDPPRMKIKRRDTS